MPTDFGTLGMHQDYACYLHIRHRAPSLIRMPQRPHIGAMTVQQSACWRRELGETTEAYPANQGRCAAGSPAQRFIATVVCPKITSGRGFGQLVPTGTIETVRGGRRCTLPHHVYVILYRAISFQSTHVFLCKWKASCQFTLFTAISISVEQRWLLCSLHERRATDGRSARITDFQTAEIRWTSTKFQLSNPLSLRFFSHVGMW